MAGTSRSNTGGRQANTIGCRRWRLIWLVCVPKTLSELMNVDGIAAMDLFVVPTISFRLLYGLLIMGVCTENLI